MFLNIPQLERQGADIQSKVEELEEVNQSLRTRDKLNGKISDSIYYFHWFKMEHYDKLSNVQQMDNFVISELARDQTQMRGFGEMRDNLIYFCNQSNSGTGLGLFISKKIIEAHDGTIWAENNISGKGATFSFSIPLNN